MSVKKRLTEILKGFKEGEYGYEEAVFKIEEIIKERIQYYNTWSDEREG